MRALGLIAAAPTLQSAIGGAGFNPFSAGVGGVTWNLSQ